MGSPISAQSGKWLKANVVFDALQQILYKSGFSALHGIKVPEGNSYRIVNAASAAVAHNKTRRGWHWLHRRGATGYGDGLSAVLATMCIEEVGFVVIH